MRLIELLSMLEGNVAVYIDGKRKFAETTYFEETYPDYIVDSMVKENASDKYYSIHAYSPARNGTELEKYVYQLKDKSYPILTDQITALRMIEDKLREHMEYSGYSVSYYKPNEQALTLCIKLERMNK